MSQRLEVMLTSRRPDGLWTWRAAGARQPKGVLEAGLLPADAAIGDILRVEAEVGLDGISVRQVLPPKAERPPPPRVEHLGTKRFAEGVTGAAPSGRAERSGEGRGDGDRPRREGGAGRSRRSDGRRGPSGSGGRGSRERRERAPRLRAASAHRDAWSATLSPDHKAIAERLANEGIRAVRQSLQGQEDSEAAEPGAKPSAPAAGPSVAAVEELFSAMRAADWRDRAEAAQGVSDDVDLRDLRSVVAATPREFPDEQARTLADELRGKLAARVDREHSAWIADLGSLLRKGRLITALRVSQRPPKTGTPLPASLAGSLREAAGAQLGADADDDLWVRMLEAAAQSPIRLILAARDVPEEPSERLLRAVRRFGERLPALRAQFAEHLDPPAQASEPTGADPVPEATEPGVLAAEEAPQATEPGPSGEAEDPVAEPDESAGGEDAEGAELSAGVSADAESAEEVGETAGEVEVA